MSNIVPIPDTINRLSKLILDECFYIHTQLGPGLLESVYEDCLYHLLLKKNIKVERQKILPITFDDKIIPSSLKLDLIVEDQIILELKSVEKLMPVHEAQLYTYLKLSHKPLGLLLNFNVKSMKDGIKRMAMTKA